MNRLRYALLAFVLATAPLVADAANVQIQHNYPSAQSPGCTNGLCLSAGGLDSTQYTGWIHVAGYRAATIGVEFVDANDSVTALNITCWTAYDATTANGSGYEVCSGATATGTTTLTCPHTWTLTTGTAEQFNFTVDNLNAIYLNCSFAGTGTPAAADTVTARVLTKTP